MLGALVSGGQGAEGKAESRAVVSARSAAEQTVPSTPTAGAVAEVPQPQAEAAALKRDAVAVAVQAAGAYPEDALTYALLGSAYYNTGRADEAAKYLQKCLELSPGQAEAYEMLGLIAYEKGKPEEAARLCQEAMKRGPTNPEVLNRLGRAFLDMGQTEEAIRTLQQAVRLAKPISESWYLLGQSFLQSGDRAQAKESFLKAVELVPDHTQAYFGLYTASMRLGLTEEAERYREQFQKLEAIDRRALTVRSAEEDTLTGLPQVRRIVARTFFGAAQVHRSHGQRGQAAELFHKAASLDADNPTYRAALEALYVQGKDLGEGVKAFQQLAAAQPDNSLNYFFLGRLHSRLGQFEAAEQNFQKVKELASDWSEGYRALAELYLRTNNKTVEAQRLARRVVELEPSGSNYFLLAVACSKNKDRAGSLEAVKQALAINPQEKRYQQFLEHLQQTP